MEERGCTDPALLAEPYSNHCSNSGIRGSQEPMILVQHAAEFEKDTQC